MSVAKLVAVAIVFASLGRAQDSTICSPDSNTFTTKINFHEGHLGYYEFDECEGVNPTIGLKIGETYTFLQGDRTNWFHPLGFAYGPDGAHDEQDELEPGITRTASNCTANNSCPAPRYQLDGVFLGDVSNPEDFGLDVYEPRFFLPVLDWIDQGTFSVQVTFDDASIGQDAFYFCHIHEFMSGRIKFLDADSGEPLVAADTPPLGYDYDTPGEFDQMCGTVGLDAWQLPNPACPDQFVCGTSMDNAELQLFADCLDAMNCRMMAGMTTNIGTDVISLFNYHMIPHHENAVDMAKALLPNVPCDDLSNEDDVNCIMQTLVLEIINTQNFQIQTMRNVLEMLGSPPQDDCEVKVAVTSENGNGTVKVRSSGRAVYGSGANVLLFLLSSAGVFCMFI